MKPLVWSLDDEKQNGETVQSTLLADGWRDDSGHGVEFESFESKSAIISKLGTIEDKAHLPCLFLLDVNLGGSEGQPQDLYGGFEVWKAILDKCRDLHALEPQWTPHVVLYTRSSSILPLARHLDHELARPQVIPFGAGARIGNDNVRSALSIPLARALNIIATRIFSRYDSKMYKELKDAVNKAKSSDSLLEISLGAYRISSIAPQIVLKRSGTVGYLDVIKQELITWISSGNRSLRSILSEMLDSLRNELDLPARKDIDISVIASKVGLESNILEAARENGSFFSAVRLVYSDKSEPKVGHLIQDWINDSPRVIKDSAEKLIRAVALESMGRWGNAIENYPTVTESQLWSSLAEIANSSSIVKCNLSKLHDTIRRYDFTSEVFPLGQAMAGISARDLEPRNKGKMLAVTIEDLMTMSNCVFREVSGAEIQANAYYDRRWLVGALRLGIHLFCSRGKSDGLNSAITMGAMNSARPKANSLSELADMVCRIYGGQLIVGDTNGDGLDIDAMIIRYPGSKSSVHATSDQKNSIYKIWRDELRGKDSISFNIISFGYP